MVTVDDVRAIAGGLPRSYEVLVRDRVKFRVGRLVYLAFSRDETLMGFAFPKEERELLVASDPGKFLMPVASDMGYNWARSRLSALDFDEMQELVLGAWQMVVPKRVAEERLAHWPTQTFSLFHRGPPLGWGSSRRVLGPVRPVRLGT